VTRSAIELAVYRATNKNTSSIDTATQTRIRHFINSRHRRLLAMPGMEVCRRTTTTFNSVANDSEFTLEGVSAVKRVWETTNDRELDWLSLADYRALDPDPDASPGLPTHVVFINYVDGDWVGHLYPQPSGIVAYQADVEEFISDLASDDAEPQLPDDFHFLVELGATIDELRKMDDGRYKVVDEEYRDGLRDLLYRLARQRASQPIAAERSTLGAWYPADR
jgi:hypothetical protein